MYAVFITLVNLNLILSNCRVFAIPFRDFSDGHEFPTQAMLA